MTDRPTDVSALPATVVPEEAMTDQPLGEIAEGDLVVIFSRGRNRLAQVTKVGPKRVEVIYTTQGAWDTAQRIYENYLAPDYADRCERQSRSSAASNYAYYQGEIDPATRKYQHTDEAIAEYQEEVEGVTAAEYVERQAARERARAERLVAEAREGGVARYVHVTSKSIGRQHVYGLVREVV